MSYTTLVDVATLAAHLGDPDWLVVDVRHQLADTGYAVPRRDLDIAMRAAGVPEGRIRPLSAGEHWWLPE